MPQIPFIVKLIIYIVLLATSYAIQADSARKMKHRLADMMARMNKGGSRVDVRWDTVAAHQWVYGRIRVGGVVAFANSTGYTGSYFNSIQVLAGHEVDAVETVYFNDTPSSNYYSNAQVWTYTGQQNQVPADDMCTRFGQWTTSHKLGGLTYVAASLFYNPDVWQGGTPTITAVVRGKKVYDPRTQETKYSTNAALCILDVTRNLLNIPDDFIDMDSFIHAANVCDVPILKKLNMSFYGDVTEGSKDIAMEYPPNVWVGMRVTSSCLQPETFVTYTEDAQWVQEYDYEGYTDESFGYWYGENRVSLSKPAISASLNHRMEADVYEPQYTINGAFTLDEQPNKILIEMLTACNGNMVFANGKYKLLVGEWTEPVATLDENDLRDGMLVKVTPAAKDLFNGVKGTFIPPESFWQPTEYPMITSDTFETQDAGDRKLMELDLPYTDSPSIAQRLAKQELLGSRIASQIQFPAKFTAYRLEIGDNVIVKNKHLGWEGDDQVFQVVDVKADYQQMTVDLTLERTSPAVFDWNADEEQLLQSLPKPRLPDPSYVGHPINIAVTKVQQMATDGTVNINARVAWNQIWEYYTGTEVEYKASNSSEWKLAARLPVSSNQNYAEVWIDAPGQNYDFRIRNVGSIGQTSRWVESLNVMMTGDSIAPSAPSNLSVTATTASAYIKWGNNPADYDYSYTLLNFTANASSNPYYNKEVRIKGDSYSVIQTTSDIVNYAVTASNVDNSGNVSGLVSASFTIDQHQVSPPDPAFSSSIDDRLNQTQSTASNANNTANNANNTANNANNTANNANNNTNNLTGSFNNFTGSYNNYTSSVSNSFVSVNNTITNLQNVYNSYTSSVDVTGLRNQVNALSSSYLSSSGSWNSQISGWNTSFNTLNNQVVALNSDYSVNKTVVSASLASQSGSIRTISSSLSTLNTDYSANKTSVSASLASMSGSVGTISSSLNSTNSTLTTLQTNYSNSSASWNSNISTLQGTVTSNSSSAALRMDSISSQLNTASSSIAARLTTDEATIVSNSSSFATRASSIETSVTNNSSSLAARATTTESSLTTTSSSLAARITTLTANDTTLSSSLSGRVATTEAALVTQSSSFASRSTTIETNFQAFTGSFNSFSSSFSSRITTDENSISSNSASFATRTTNIESNATNISSSAAARATTIESTATNTSSSLAARLTTLSSSFNSSSGSWNSRFTTVEGSITTNSSSAALRSSTLESSYNAFTGSFNTFSSSYSARITSNEGTITTNSSSIAARITNVEANVTNNSASIAARVGTAETAITTNSSSLAGRVTTVQSSFNTFTGSFNTFSSSYSSRITTDESTISTNSSSFATRTTNIESAANSLSSSLSARVATTETTITTNSSSMAGRVTTIESSVTNNSASIAARITTAEGTITTNSSSAAIRSTNLESSYNAFTGSFNTFSSSYSARITTNEGTITNNSSSMAGRVTTIETNVTNNSASIAARVGTAETAITTNSSSLAGRVTTVQSSFNTFTGSFNTFSSSYSSRITTNENTISTNSSSFATRATVIESNVTTVSSSLAARAATIESTATTNSSSFAGRLTTLDTSLTNVSSSQSARITTAEGAISNNSASFAVRTTTLESNLTTETNNRINGDNQISSSFSARITTDETVITNNSSSIAARATAIEANATAVSSSMAARVTTAETAITNNSASFASRTTSLVADYIARDNTERSQSAWELTQHSSSISARVTTNEVALSTLSGSLASRTSTVEANYITESAIRAAADNAEGTARVNGDTNVSSSAAARCTTIESAAATNSGSFASRITSVTATANSATASITTLQNAYASFSGSVAAEYVLSVNAGKITGMHLVANATTSSFTIVADQFKIVPSSGTGTGNPFIYDANGLRVDSAYIKDLSADKITAGTITANISITSPTIVGTGIYINSYKGVSYVNDSNVVTVNGGSANGINHGAQIDFCGATQPNVAGCLNISAGDGNNSSLGYISFRTGAQIWDATNNGYINTERMKISYSGLIQAFSNVQITGSISTTSNATIGGTLSTTSTATVGSSNQTNGLRNITVSTSDPSGGSDGEVWLKV